MGLENMEVDYTEKPGDLPKTPGGLTEPQPSSVLPNLQVKIKRLELNFRESIKVTKLMLAFLPESKYKSSEATSGNDSEKIDDNYDNDKTEIYYPTKEDKPTPKHALVPNKGIKVTHFNKTKKCLIHAHPSWGSFKISVHGLVKCRTRTYIRCKIRGCKAKFASIHDWNSHHRKYHKCIKLSCAKHNKLFKTPSFLRDHNYIHSDKSFPCKKCNKVFPCSSMYRITIEPI